MQLSQTGLEIGDFLEPFRKFQKISKNINVHLSHKWLEIEPNGQNMVIIL